MMIILFIMVDVMVIKIGTCGWSVRGGKQRYFEYFNVIELQDTFYRLPKVSTAEKWGAIAPENFEYTLKAWQTITHPPTSPTWRRAGLKIDRNMYDKYGFFRPTREVFDAWDKFNNIVKALKARIIIFQTPASFKYSKENESNIRSFFSSIERGKLIFGWEPRGNWYEYPEKLERILRELDLIHVVDILRRNPIIDSEIYYFRLHGLGGREVNYRYKYSDEDLHRLKDSIKKYLPRKIYVMFNNIYMFQDALRFKEIIEAIKY